MERDLILNVIKFLVQKQHYPSVTRNIRLSIIIIYVPGCQLSKRMNDSLHDKF